MSVGTMSPRNGARYRFVRWALIAPALCMLLALMPVRALHAKGDAAGAPVLAAAPIEGILAAISSHEVVALGEGNHGNVQGHEVRMALVRDPRFAAMVDDIVVEFGNSLYQSTVDRYTNGEDVPREALRKIWENTTQGHAIWDVPIYEEFFTAIRTVNAGLASDRKLRVLLGDAPIDWDRVHSLADHAKQPQRTDARVVDIIEREVLARHRKALVVYGDFHFSRQPADTIVSLLERHGHSVFSVWTNTQLDLTALQPNLANVLVPSLLQLGDTLGIAQPFDGRFDAVLFLGAPSNITYSLPSPSLCRDEAYVRRRLARMRLSPKTADIAVKARIYCASVAPGSELSPAFDAGTATPGR